MQYRYPRLTPITEAAIPKWVQSHRIGEGFAERAARSMGHADLRGGLIEGGSYRDCIRPAFRRRSLLEGLERVQDRVCGLIHAV